MGEKVEQLKAHAARGFDLQLAAALLNWDQEVYMPPGGMEARAEQLATLQGLAHEILTGAEAGQLLAAAEAEVAGWDYDSDEASWVRISRREYDRLVKLPSEVIAEQARLASQAFPAWREARASNQFAIFRPLLQKTVDLNRRVADILGYTEHPYDALLDIYEPGMKTSEVTRLFNDLKAGLVPFLQEIVQRGQPTDATFFDRDYDEARQWDFTLVLLRAIGYDFNRGRQDRAPHPFTTTFSVNDVRVTNRFLRRRPQTSIFGAIHEGGHGLYEQGVPTKFDRTVLMGGTTYGVHESQSRLWENIVGRSRPFWQYFFPIFSAFFPEPTTGVTLEQFYRAINQVQPSLIRVEADEVTYSMHIFVRFELEQALITGDLKVEDVPEAWNAKYQEYLGITPPTDADGCLQDIHWSHGTIGYFPTYALGTIIAAQLYAQAKAELPGLEEGFARGEFQPLLRWLREKVHVHGRKFVATELVQRVTGGPISVQPLLDYMRAKYSDVYGL